MVALASLWVATPALGQAIEPVRLQRGLNALVRAMGGTPYVAATLGSAPTQSLQALFKAHPSLLADPNVQAYVRIVRTDPDNEVLAEITPPSLLRLETALAELPSSSLKMLEGPGPAQRMLGCEDDKACSLNGLMADLESATLQSQFAPPWVRELKNENVLYNPTTPLQNAAFMQASRAEDGAPFYFHVENAVLKLLNDHYFHDRELSHAVTNLYKKIFFENLNDVAGLSDKIAWVEVSEPGIQSQARYADYKSIRLALTEDTPEIREALEAVFKKTTLEFVAAVDERPQMRFLTDDARHRLVRDPATWFLAGMGKTADQAAWSARFARRGSPVDGTVPVPAFDDEETLLKFRGLMERFESNIKMLSDRCGPRCGLLEQFRDGLILRQRAIEILRKIPADDQAEYIRIAQARVKEAFGKELTREDVLLLQNIVHISESFAPSIYIENQAIIDLADAPHGLMAVDLAGQNSRNLQQVMRNLVKAYETRGNVAAFEPEATRTLALIREGQDAASRAFEVMEKRLLEAIERSELQGHEPFSQANGVLVSGDDMVFAPEVELTPEQKDTVVATAAFRAKASNYRITFVRPDFGDPGDMAGVFPDAPPYAVSKRELAQYIVLGEDLEKAIRLELLSEVIPLEGVLIAVDVSPQMYAFDRVEILLAGNRATPEIRAQVEQAVRDIAHRWAGQGRYVSVSGVRVIPKYAARISGSGEATTP